MDIRKHRINVYIDECHYEVAIEEINYSRIGIYNLNNYCRLSEFDDKMVDSMKAIIEIFKDDNFYPNTDILKSRLFILGSKDSMTEDLKKDSVVCNEESIIDVVKFLYFYLNCRDLCSIDLSDILGCEILDSYNGIKGIAENIELFSEKSNNYNSVVVVRLNGSESERGMFELYDNIKVLEEVINDDVSYNISELRNYDNVDGEFIILTMLS